MLHTGVIKEALEREIEPMIKRGYFILFFLSYSLFPGKRKIAMTVTKSDTLSVTAS